MNLFDARAPLMAPLFSGPGTQPPYQADDKNLRSGLIYQMNAKSAPGAKESAQMNFSRPDAAECRRAQRDSLARRERRCSNAGALEFAKTHQPLRPRRSTKECLLGWIPS